MNLFSNRSYVKLPAYALFTIGVSLNWASTSYAQQFQNIVIPTVENNSVTPQVSKKPIDSALIELEDTFLNMTQEQQADMESELGISISDGKVVVEAIASVSAEMLLEQLEAIGLENGSVFGKMVSGYLPISKISEAESLTGLQFLRLAKRAVRVGTAENQADRAMSADLAKTIYSVDGAGISIGILSDSYNVLNGEAADIASGDIPTGVNVLDDTAIGFPTDEGRAMAQLIHDVAPGANLLFHTAFNGAPDFAQGILDLADAGADVIVDDVGYLEQPMFQDGVIAQAVDQVEANGVVYFSSAGNSADRSYEAAYTDSGLSLPAEIFPLTNLHDFDPSDGVDVTQELIIPSGGSIRLSIQWDEPFASAGGAGSASDVDVILFDNTGNVVAREINANFRSDAVEFMDFVNSGPTATFAIVFGVFSGPVPQRIKAIDFSGSVTAVNYTTFSSTIFGHPNAAGAIAVGAANYRRTPRFGLNPPQIETFSSHGGTQILFDIAGNRIAPVDRNKPEIVAPDGVDTTFFGIDSDFNGFPNFFGTSAAAPNAAALAALQLECDSALSPTDILAHQIIPAIDMGTAGFDSISGNGLVDAVGTLDLSCQPPNPQVTCNGLLVTVNLNLGQTATSGSDVILGTSGPDNIQGQDGDDTICGEGGDDVIHGNRGNDWIDGGDGVDNIDGGLGNDVIFTGLGATVGTDFRAFGGEGNDEITGDSDNDAIRGGSGMDRLNGEGGNDSLFGEGDADVLNGGDGADMLIGGNGNDELNGGAGDDVLNGDDGDDRLDGGAGTDDVCDVGSGGSDTANPDCETILNVP